MIARSSVMPYLVGRRWLFLALLPSFFNSLLIFGPDAATFSLSYKPLTIDNTVKSCCSPCRTNIPCLDDL